MFLLIDPKDLMITGLVKHNYFISRFCKLFISDCVDISEYYQNRYDLYTFF